MSTSILEIITHYQKSIEKSQDDEARLIYCIGKLYKLPINVEHLQETGVGKTVNALRKYNGEIGIAAKTLVTKWKAMVAAEEEVVESTYETDNQKRSSDDDQNDNGTPTPSSNNNPTIENTREKEEKSSNNNTTAEGSKDSVKEKKESSSSSHHKTSSSKHSNASPSTSSSSDKHHKSREKVGKSSHRDHDSKETEEKRNTKREHTKHGTPTATPARDKTKSSAAEINEKKSSSKSSSSSRHKTETSESRRSGENHSKTTGKEMNDHDKHHSSSSSSSSSRHKTETSESRRSEENHSKTTGKETKDHDKHHSSSSSSSSRHKTETSESRRSGENHSKSTGKETKDHDKHHSSGSRHKTETSESRRSEDNHSETTEKERKDHDKHRSSRDHDRNSSKSNVDSKCDKNTNNGALLSSSSSSSKEKNDKKSKHEHRDDKKDKSSRSGSSKNKTSSSSSSSSHRKRHSSDSTETTSPKAKIAKVLDDGIDCSTGASFADVLGGMCNLPTLSSKSSKSCKSAKLTSKPPTSHNSDDNKPSISNRSIQLKTTTTNGISSSQPSSSTKEKPDLLLSSCKLEPLDASIALELPAITTNYKPMPLNQTVMNCVFAQTPTPKPFVRTLTDAEALQHGISSKTMRTKIYSGVRTGAIHQVETLSSLCIRVLQKNIDSFEYTGGVPFEILEPVLTRATPMQLLTFEEYNPYLMDDTDVLWQEHVERHYRDQKRQEMESWKEMFLRCQENQERKLNFLAEKIKLSQKQIAMPVRKTQLAFVDSMVKPPRNIIRKQEQFGTKAKLIATPASRVAALSSVTPNAAKTGDTRLRIAPCVQDPAQVSKGIRPKKAPLMAKTLQFMKGRFKR